MAPKSLLQRLIIVIAVALVTVAQGGIVLAAPPNGSEPTGWNCDGPRLGLDDDAVGLAPTDIGDTAPDGSAIKRVPDSRGKYVPIIMVHGWVGTSTHTAERDGAFSHLIDLTSLTGQQVTSARSMIGQLQRMPGAAVFTFDYRDYAARWVDDIHLGPALGKVIDCLYRASGEKVIIVAHSMGGLIARYAATHVDLDGTTDRTSEISTVVTFGTPETGSVAAMMAAGVIDTVALDAKPVAILRLILAACGSLSSVNVVTGSVCDVLPPPFRAFASDAGVALRYGSQQLRTLKPFPPGIRVDAVAGSASFQVPAAGWFALPWDTTPVDVGDLIVTTDSALNGTKISRSTRCMYQLNSVRGATDQVGLLLRTVSRAEVAPQPLASFNGACFHTHLMRGIELTNEATGAVADDLAARQPVTATDLLSAPVPATCGHRAGTLVNGSLTGIPANEGMMQLGWKLTNPANMSNNLVLGDLTGDGAGDAATVLECNAGGVPWPDLVAFYTHGPKLLGAVSLSEFTVPGVQPGDRAFVHAIKYANGAVEASWTSEQDGDPSCCGTLDYSATLRWDGKHVIAENVQGFTEVPTLDAFVAAIRVHNADRARSVATPDAVERATTLASTFPEAFTSGWTCQGLIGQLPDAVFALTDPGPGRHSEDTSRVCYRSIEGGFIVAGLSKSGYRQWNVQWMESV